MSAATIAHLISLRGAIESRRRAGGRLSTVSMGGGPAGASMRIGLVRCASVLDLCVAQACWTRGLRKLVQLVRCTSGFDFLRCGTIQARPQVLGASNFYR